MRHLSMLTAGCLLLAACGKNASQADALDRAASQSDPAAAAELHNQADAIRDMPSGSDAAAAAVAQNAMQAAGNAAAANPTPAAQPETRPVDRQTGLTR